MVRQIVRDPLFLQQKSLPATREDKQVMIDLIDTLRANQDRCVGMAANMIGVKKQIIAIMSSPFIIPMVNPKKKKKSGKYETEEGCLSLDGLRPCTRYKEIEVNYLDADFKPQHGRFEGFTAQIIQHEVQHFSGELI